MKLRLAVVVALIATACGSSSDSEIAPDTTNASAATPESSAPAKPQRTFLGADGIESIIEDTSTLR